MQHFASPYRVFTGKESPLTVGCVEFQDLEQGLQVADMVGVVLDQVQCQQQCTVQASFHTKLAICKQCNTTR